MKKNLRLKECLLFLFVFFPVLVNGASEWPKEGMKAHWDFTKRFNLDLLRKVPLEFNKFRIDNGKYIFVDTLSNGKIAFDDYVALPYDIADLDSFTIVLKFCLNEERSSKKEDSAAPQYDVQDMDGKFLYLNEICAVEADDGVLELMGFISEKDTVNVKTEFDIDIEPNENGEFVIVATYLNRPTDNTGWASKIPYGNKVLFGCGTNGVMKYYYRTFRNGANLLNKDSDGRIKIVTDKDNKANLVEIVLYDRVLPEQELAQVMDVEKVSVMPADIDVTDWWDWRYVFYLWIVALVLNHIRKEKKYKKYPLITANYIVKRFGQEKMANCRERALVNILLLWNEFGDKKKPVYPQDVSKVRNLFESTLATGCVDRDVLAEYNRLAILINKTSRLELGMMGPMAAVLVFAVASIGPLFNKQWEYEIHTTGFVVYWVAIVVCFISSLQVIHGTPGNRMKNVKLQMNMIGFLSNTISGIALGAGSALGAALYVVMAGLVLFLYVLSSCIYTFSVVVVSTGAVVATGTSGFLTGFFCGIAVLAIVGYLLQYLWVYIVWVIVLVLPYASYKITKNIRES